MPSYILSIVLFLPLVAAILLLFLKRNSSVIWLSTVASALTTGLSGLLVINFNPKESGFQYVHWIPDWIVSGRLSIDYMIGLDGIALLLFFLTSFLFFLSSLTTWKNINVRIKEFHFCLLFLEFAVLGIFSSLNTVLFYIFWELMVIPMALMIGVWGGDKRIFASVKYLIFSMAGSLFMLAGILILYFKTGTTSIETLSLIYSDQFSPGMRIFVFISFAMAFSIKIPVFPLHTWMPDVHTEAPTVGSVDLAGVLLKLGVFGFIRFLIPMFPEVSLQARDIFSILSIIGILWGAFSAMVQEDIKRIIAYSSLSHLSFTLLGFMSFTELGVAGAMLQLISHGISTGMLFILIGIFHDRMHTRLISHVGGVAGIMPIYSVFFVIAMLSSVGLPGTNGFIGEFLILMGTMKYNYIYGGIAATGVIWTSCYLLWLTKRFIFGEKMELHNKKPKDIEFREFIILIPLVAAIFSIGLFPGFFLRIIEPSVNTYLNSASVRLIEERKVTLKNPNFDYKSLGAQPMSYEERMGIYKTGREIPIIEKVNRIFQEKENLEPVDPPPIMEEIESTNEIEKALDKKYGENP
jgi:NADH-quinone oxidoreductase subunit M